MSIPIATPRTLNIRGSDIIPCRSAIPPLACKAATFCLKAGSFIASAVFGWLSSFLTNPGSENIRPSPMGSPAPPANGPLASFSMAFFTSSKPRLRTSFAGSICKPVSYAETASGYSRKP